MVTNIEKKYLEIMRRKSGQERLKIALELRKLALKLAEAKIKEENPKISSPEARKLLLKRIYGFSLPSKAGGE